LIVGIAVAGDGDPLGLFAAEDGKEIFAAGEHESYSSTTRKRNRRK
jgi:hypothetical protein